MPPQSTYKKANLRLSKRPENTAIFHSDSSGKEKDSETGYYYFGARYYNSDLSLWLSVDPMSDKYPSLSPYNYCAWNPIKIVDPDGNDWYEYTEVKTGKTEIRWTDYHSQEQMDKNGLDGKYLGQAHVLFNGSRGEKLGEGGFINGQGSVTADVTVYGPNGEDDITHMTGFTMTSNYSKYGAIAEGLYNANYDAKGKSGRLKSNWVLEHRGSIGTIDNEPNLSPYAGYNYGLPVKDGIFIHSTNSNGYAGGNVSTGCLLLAPDDFKRFNTIMSGVKDFTVRVTRTQYEYTPLKGVTGSVPNMFTVKKITRR
jgi:RHS repeat-associated protein